MNKFELKEWWKTALNRDPPDMSEFKRLAAEIEAVYRSGDEGFRRHIENCWKRVESRTGVAFEPDDFDDEMAKAFIADEMDFSGWGELERSAAEPDKGGMLFRYAIAAMERGDFTALEEAIGKDEFHHRIVDWKEGGLFDGHQETLDEILSAACMLGQTETAKYLIEQGIDPYAGMRSWLAGPHYAVSSGRLETVRMLIEKNIPLDVENRYGGTMLGQALWSAINEHTDSHAEIIELLLAAGAHVWPGTAEWWQKQDVPSAVTKERVAAALGSTR